MANQKVSILTTPPRAPLPAVCHCGKITVPNSIEKASKDNLSVLGVLHLFGLKNTFSSFYTSLLQGLSHIYKHKQYLMRDLKQ